MPAEPEASLGYACPVRSARCLLFLSPMVGPAAASDGDDPCGLVREARHSATLRTEAGSGVHHLKVKGPPAAALFYALSGDAPEGGRVCHQKRLGRDYVGSTQNAVDRVVVELRWTADGVPMPAEAELYHSPERNRVYGEATLVGHDLVIRGPAGAGLTAALGLPDATEVTIPLADLSAGTIGPPRAPP